MSFITQINRNGPRIEPYDTPHFIGKAESACHHTVHIGSRYLRKKVQQLECITSNVICNYAYIFLY